MRYQRHLFACTNQRPSGGKPSCGGRGGDALVTALQRAVAIDDELVGAIAVTPCGCLGPCFDGPMLVAYPDGVWLAGVQEADLPDLLGWLRGGALPERLRYRFVDDDD